MSADTRWPFSEFVWGQARCCFRHAIASYWLTSVSSKLLKSMSFTRVLTRSMLPHFFAHKIFKIYILNQMNYCTIGSNLMCMCPGSQARRRGVTTFGRNASYSFMQYFH